MKTIVRNNILSKLNSISSDEKSRLSSLIEKNLAEVLKDENGSWVAFHNLKDEPKINWTEISSQIEWAFPKIAEDSLEFHEAAESYNKSTLGFLEPHGGVKVELEQIRGFVIPGLSFDKAGHRLGRGKGYYDRALSDFEGQKIGVCFNVSFCEELPHEAHDIICDQIVTDKQIFNVLKSEGVRKWN